MKNISLIAVVFCLLFLTACSFQNDENKVEDDNQITNEELEKLNEDFTLGSEAKYNLYMDLLGNVGFIQIEEITENNIEYSNPFVLNFKNKGMNIGSMVEEDGRIFASIYDDGGIGNGKKVAVIKDNKIQKYISFQDNDGLSYIIEDDSNNKAYIMTAVKPSSANPNGTPFVSFNTKTGKKLPAVNIKGIVESFAVNGDAIYLVVYGARKLGYTAVPDRYIAKLNRSNGNIKVLTSYKNKPVSAKIRNGRLHLLTTNDEQSVNINTYNLKGKLLNNFSFGLEQEPSDMVIHSNGMAYISHIGSNYDGNQVTVFDTKTNQVVKKIKGFTGSGDMEMKDQYLFVSNEGSSSVGVINMHTNKLIDTINFGLPGGSNGVAVQKNTD